MRLDGVEFIYNVQVVVILMLVHVAVSLIGLHVGLIKVSMFEKLASSMESIAHDGSSVRAQI